MLRVDDGTYELVDGYMDYLSGKISKYFGQPLPVNLVKSSEFISSVSSFSAPAEKNSDGIVQEPDNYEKLRAALIKDFNAKEVN